MILNLAIGGNWAGNATMLTTSGGTMSVDYVGVWRKGEADPEPTGTGMLLDYGQVVVVILILTTIIHLLCVK